MLFRVNLLKLTVAYNRHRTKRDIQGAPYGRGSVEGWDSMWQVPVTQDKT